VGRWVNGQGGRGAGGQVDRWAGGQVTHGVGSGEAEWSPGASVHQHDPGVAGVGHRCVGGQLLWNLALHDGLGPPPRR